MEPCEKDHLELYLKGADEVIREKVSRDKKILIDEKTFDLASIGLRTLCFGHKKLAIKQFEDFEDKFKRN